MKIYQSEIISKKYFLCDLFFNGICSILCSVFVLYFNGFVLYYVVYFNGFVLYCELKLTADNRSSDPSIKSSNVTAALPGLISRWVDAHRWLWGRNDSSSCSHLYCVHLNCVTWAKEKLNNNKTSSFACLQKTCQKEEYLSLGLCWFCLLMQSIICIFKWPVTWVNIFLFSKYNVLDIF